MILFYILKRIPDTQIETYNKIIMKYMSYIYREEGEGTEKLTFYLNFIIGDRAKTKFYSSIIQNVVDENTQNKILDNMDRYIPDLKFDVIEEIKQNVCSSEKPKQSSSSNIDEITHKLKWMYNKDNYCDFYSSVLEMARVFMINDHIAKLETLYDKLKYELNQCEINDHHFQDDGLYKLLQLERKKHQTYIKIQKELDTYTQVITQLQV